MFIVLLFRTDNTDSKIVSCNLFEKNLHTPQQMALSKWHYDPLTRSSDPKLPETITVHEIHEDDQFHDASPHSRSLIHSRTLTRALFLLIAVQILFIMHLLSTAHSKVVSPSALTQNSATHDQWLMHPLDCRSFSRNFERLGSNPWEYMSENEAEAAKAWSEIDADHGLVAVDAQWAAAQGLPPTMAHPRDPSKVVYVIEPYHEIHCVVSQPLRSKI